MRRIITIAIDGPAASGKSTTAKMVAARLGYTYIDSGAMYRAVTYKVLEAGISTGDAQAAAELAATLQFHFPPSLNGTRVLVNGEDLSNVIRLPHVTRSIKPIADNRAVREILVGKQRALGAAGGVVMDGRDIGTVVFPQAELKIFMVASAEARADRRCRELMEKGIATDRQAVLSDILIRDEEDRSRSYGPLLQADDAVVIDTTSLNISAQVDFIYQLASDLIDGG